jgi:hypothetical protein
VSAYEELASSYSEDRSGYEEKLGHWKSLELEERRKSKVEPLARQGRVFEIFFHYLDTLRYCDIAVTGGSDVPGGVASRMPAPRNGR